MKVRVGFVLLLTLLCLSTVAIVAAQDQYRPSFRFCPGNYALCAASTCTPTGNNIKVNGSNAKFPEADCTCPVLDGPAIADVNGGTMNGDCRPPDNGVWSLYTVEAQIPQEVTEWNPASAPLMECPKDLHQGDQLVNCFSFACDNQRYINGQLVATCHCAMGESPDGKHVPPASDFWTQAGLGNQSFCFEHPVSGTLKNQ
jgi:hypothetical protein